MVLLTPVGPRSAARRSKDSPLGPGRRPRRGARRPDEERVPPGPAQDLDSSSRSTALFSAAPPSPVPTATAPWRSRSTATGGCAPFSASAALTRVASSALPGSPNARNGNRPRNNAVSGSADGSESRPRASGPSRRADGHAPPPSRPSGPRTRPGGSPGPSSGEAHPALPPHPSRPRSPGPARPGPLVLATPARGDQQRDSPIRTLRLPSVAASLAARAAALPQRSRRGWRRRPIPSRLDVAASRPCYRPLPAGRAAKPSGSDGQDLCAGVTQLQDDVARLAADRIGQLLDSRQSRNRASRSRPWPGVALDVPACSSR